MQKINLLKIDELLLHEHHCIESTDFCYYIGEYYGRKGFNFSPMNQLIFNFKKPLIKKNDKDWSYKEQAICDIANQLKSLVPWPKLKKYCWIPIPSSKVRTDPEYDDRLVQVLKKIKNLEKDLDFREIINIKETRKAAHDPKTERRPRSSDHLSNFNISKELLLPTPRAIAIFDDVLATGASFKAVQQKLKSYFPNTPIIGVFIARNVIL
jgi:hypothetical protein